MNRRALIKGLAFGAISSALFLSETEVGLADIPLGWHVGGIEAEPATAPPDAVGSELADLDDNRRDAQFKGIDRPTSASEIVRENEGETDESASEPLIPAGG